MTTTAALTSAFDLTGKVALVTGSSRGLGRSIAGALAAAGADLVIVSRNQDACDVAAREITELTGVRTMAHACHVSHWDELDCLVDAVYERFGRVDVLVNNAGKSPLYESLLDITEELWNSVLGVNLLGPFRLSTLIGTRMADAGSGSIINISTVGSVLAEPSYLPYAAAKSGLNTITRAFAKSFAPAVRVNCIMPGPFRTDIMASWSDDQIAGMSRRLPLGRVGEPADIDGAVLWLAGGASAYVTGQVFAVDGGMSA
ncbi:SDR family NAD(P)-dependent oxidoreductase [Mycobacterium sp. AZCC_0083]|uniref:SDR family NAD(P)-dependent oxidoreductase n=1 Tax=Mycobacterium sp. AZCC_0083 TaxID=2735882 RepID=UPI0016164976|nr:glucose 1-dehydrogenase [Mycobacterium sp. AZCC_0083]MBB5161528.1 NAD(P)-dependent dehydrogenase (short-subunit alcohol dehydrogenase family) [Mycobacterium sp. AZCC_0083]